MKLRILFLFIPFIFLTCLGSQPQKSSFSLMSLKNPFRAPTQTLDEKLELLINRADDSLPTDDQIEGFIENLDDTCEELAHKFMDYLLAKTSSKKKATFMEALRAKLPIFNSPVTSRNAHHQATKTRHNENIDNPIDPVKRFGKKSQENRSLFTLQNALIATGLVSAAIVIYRICYAQDKRNSKRDTKIPPLGEPA